MLPNYYWSLRQHLRHGLHLENVATYNIKHRQNYENLALRQGKISVAVPMVRRVLASARA